MKRGIKNMYKRIIALLLAALMLFQLAACAKGPEPENTVSEADGAVVTVTDLSKKESHYTFQTKVCSPLMEEVMGTKMKEAWFSFVDAVMEGRDTFACPDQHKTVLADKLQR